MAEVEQPDEDVPVPRKTPVTGHHGIVNSTLPVPRLLSAVALASLVHAAISFGLLTILVDEQAWLDADLRAALGLIVGLTGAVALVTALLARRRGLDQATRSAPGVFGLLPSLASVSLGLTWLWSLGGLELDQAVLATVPLLACATAPGLAVALTLEHTLTALTARLEELTPGASGSHRGASGARPQRRSRSARVEPPGLAGRLTRLVLGLAVATCLLVLAHAAVHTANAEPWFESPSSWLAMLGASSLVIVATLAAASAGRSPGRDVEALAQRLDAIGWDDSSASMSASMSATMTSLRGPRPLASPVRVTSFDAVGELFSNLERLRARLAKDVRTYQQALDRTHAADAAKREFLAAVSHELRTPLNSILGFAQLLLEGDLSEAQAEDVRLILAGGRQLKDLIEDILDLSMIESGELELRFAACSLASLVEDIVDIHQAQVRERGVELAAELVDAVPEVVCDRKRIGQLLTNLLSNAIKFTEQGRVRVGLSYDAGRGEVSIAVSDTGVGIAQDELEAIFEEYQQVGSSKKKIRGTGLGLAIARRIAEAHGGTLAARSELEVGSTFTLRLPLEPPRADDPPGGLR